MANQPPPPFPSNSNLHSKQRVAYFHNNDVSRFHYGEGHPMKPARLALANDLVINYGLHKHLSMYSPRKATAEEMCSFHSEDYIEFLRRVTPENYANFAKYLDKHKLNMDDCPVFDGLYDFCQLSAGASLDAARKLGSGQCDIAVNWSGGLHHAKKFEASGFCYVNDIVLGILELLRVYPRVLYIDIDVHHGDGVQEAFLHSNRVMTLSLHRYDGMFFPRTGAINEIGSRAGKYYSLNVPLNEYIDDASYFSLFKDVVTNVMKSFQPGAIVMQCGADSLGSDRLGCFNLSIKGHGACVGFVKSFGVPMMVVGGGGYTIKNVARCWTYETSVVAGVELDTAIPVGSKYFRHYAPDYSLHPPIADESLENQNSRGYLESVKIQVAEYLRCIQHAPSVQMQEVPPDLQGFRENGNWEVDEEEDKNPDTKGVFAKRREKELLEENSLEYYDEESFVDV